jgi:hypothetical protein
MFGKQKEILPEDQVRLLPFLGIRPGVYLSVLYVLIIFVIGFLVLFYPGLANPGAVLALESEPAGAALRIDDVYMGTTPCKVFVSRGGHRLDVVMPGFTPSTRDIAVKGRVFASAFLPSTETVVTALEESAASVALTLGAAEFAAWSFTGEATAIYQMPRVLSEGAYRSGAAFGASSNDILRGAARFASTRAGLRDLVRAKVLVDNSGCSASPLSLLSSIEDIVSYLSETPGSAVWLATLLPKEQSDLVAGSAWYAGQIKRLPKVSDTPRLGERLQVETGGDAVAFREVPAGTLVQGAAFPYEVALQPFLIAESAVSHALWEQFLAARPEWKSDNLAALRKEKLVSEDYLLTLDDHALTGVASVSWHAANAFCAWLTALLPSSLSSFEVRLPTEAEWEYAAKSADSEMLNMQGELWEWCVDPYAPCNFLPASAAIIEAIASPERVVRGGLWVNQPDTRASLPPDFCSPFVSFRPVLAPKP